MTTSALLFFASLLLPNCAINANASEAFDQVSRFALDTPSASVPFNSTGGKDLLLSGHTVSTTFWNGMQHLATQKTQTFCGIATSAMALNTVAIDKSPVDDIYAPYAYWTQDNFFNNCTDDILPTTSVLYYGTTLQQLTDMIMCHNISIIGHHANETTAADFRSYVKYAVGNNYVIAANFHRSELNEKGGGHWSPIVAYNTAVDMVLLADVARYKYGPLWVPVDELYDAMLTIDSSSEKFRGFLVLSDRNISSVMSQLLLGSSDKGNGDSNTWSVIVIPIGVVSGIVLLAVIYSKLLTSKNNISSPMELLRNGGYKTVESDVGGSMAMSSLGIVYADDATQSQLPLHENDPEQQQQEGQGFR